MVSPEPRTKQGLRFVTIESTVDPADRPFLKKAHRLQKSRPLGSRHCTLAAAGGPFPPSVIFVIFCLIVFAHTTRTTFILRPD